MMALAPIRFEVFFEQAKAHYIRVRMHVACPDPKGQRFSLPAWIPGSYMIRDFARHILSIEAWNEAGQVPLYKRDKHSWQAEPTRGPLYLEYRIYAWDLSVRGAYLDHSGGFFNGTSVFLRVCGQEQSTHLLHMHRPQAADMKNWRVATALPAQQVDARGWGRYQGTDYAHLIDCPVMLGEWQALSFEVEQIPHHLIIREAPSFDAQRLRKDLQAICNQHAKLFRALPISQYWFLTQAVGEGYGGLEHRDSTLLLCSRDDLPWVGMVEPSKDYRKFLGLCSHEYFHLWHVKRIRPAVLANADLSTEAHTHLLWAFEGITSYYDDLGVLRAGCMALPDYLDTLAHTITRVMRSSGRHWQSVAESSFDAWTKLYKQDENARNSMVSYYAKGALVALGLDVHIRKQTQERLSLDDFMRYLWQEHGACERAVEETGIECALEAFMGHDVSEFFARYIYGREELPLVSWLAELGIGMRLRAAETPEDLGGYSQQAPVDTSKPITLGMEAKQQGSELVIEYVQADGPAAQAGLSAGDRILALDGWKVTAKTLALRVQRAGVGSMHELHVFRRDALMCFQVRAQYAPQDTCELWLLPKTSCSEEVVSRQRRWLQGS